MGFVDKKIKENIPRRKMGEKTRGPVVFSSRPTKIPPPYLPLSLSKINSQIKLLLLKHTVSK